jgi:hypothetical protein
LSEYYQTEIGICDIQRGRIEIFGHLKNFFQRVYLIYDGIHYDPLALSYSGDLPEDMDITIFHPKDLYVWDCAQKITEEENLVELTFITSLVHVL